MICTVSSALISDISFGHTYVVMRKMSRACYTNTILYTSQETIPNGFGRIFPFQSKTKLTSATKSISRDQSHKCFRMNENIHAAIFGIIPTGHGLPCSRKKYHQDIIGRGKIKRSEGIEKVRNYLFWNWGGVHNRLHNVHAIG